MKQGGVDEVGLEEWVAGQEVYFEEPRVAEYAAAPMRRAVTKSQRLLEKCGYARLPKHQAIRENSRPVRLLGLGLLGITPSATTSVPREQRASVYVLSRNLPRP